MRKRRLQGGKCADPAWTHARAVKAGQASAKARRQLLIDRAAGFASKAHAYVAGYRAGARQTHRLLRKSAA